MSPLDSLLCTVLRQVVGERVADMVLGDLEEESPRRGAGWRRAQLVRSIARLGAERLTLRTRASRWRTAIAFATLVLGLEQARSSRVFDAPAAIVALVGLAIALPVLTLLLCEAIGARVAAAGATLVLLTIARVASPLPHPTLHLIALFACWPLLAGPLLQERPRDDDAAPA